MAVSINVLEELRCFADGHNVSEEKAVQMILEAWFAHQQNVNAFKLEWGSRE